MKSPFNTTIAAILSIFSCFSHAWGGDGHKIVATIAQNNLTPTAVTKVNKLLEGKSLIDVASWADTQRRFGSNFWRFETAHWHYINLNKLSDLKASNSDEINHVYDAIQFAIATLNHVDSSNSEKQLQLKLLVHFVGDIHQPLHTGLKEDKGGNAVKINWQEQTTNLHAVWDSKIIGSLGLSTQELLTQLEKMSVMLDELPTLKSASVKAWLTESYLLRGDVYDFTGDTVSEHYVDVAQNIIKRRLVLAGQRLAYQLNKAFDNTKR